jgi:hypothetical protein
MCRWVFNQLIWSTVFSAVFHVFGLLTSLQIPKFAFGMLISTLTIEAYYVSRFHAKNPNLDAAPSLCTSVIGESRSASRI